MRDAKMSKDNMTLFVGVDVALVMKITGTLPPVYDIKNVVTEATSYTTAIGKEVFSGKPDDPETMKDIEIILLERYGLGVFQITMRDGGVACFIGCPTFEFGAPYVSANDFLKAEKGLMELFGVDNVPNMRYLLLEGLVEL